MGSVRWAQCRWKQEDNTHPGDEIPLEHRVNSRERAAESGGQVRVVDVRLAQQQALSHRLDVAHACDTAHDVSDCLQRLLSECWSDVLRLKQMNDWPYVLA